MATMRWILVSLLVGVCSLGCAKKDISSEALWANITNPTETFTEYIESLRQKDFEKAVGFIYVADEERLELFKSGWSPLANRIASENWKVSILATVEKGRFASLIWTSTEARDDPSPILAINDNGRWKIHHDSISGRLRDICNEEEFATAQQVVTVSYQKIKEIKAKQAQLIPPAS